MAKGGGMKGVGGKRSNSFTGKSKLVSTGKFPQSFKPTGSMFGKQSVKPAKAR
jgi:hypothetical protein